MERDEEGKKVLDNDRRQSSNGTVMLTGQQGGRSLEGGACGWGSRVGFNLMPVLDIGKDTRYLFWVWILDGLMKTSKSPSEMRSFHHE